MIKIKVKTNGYGGRTLKKKIRVRTDDSAVPTAMLTIQGVVEKVVDIRPKNIVFQGDSGQIDTKVITIIPTKKYPLNILDATFKTGKFLTCELEKIQVNGVNAFKVIVKTTQEASGNFYDQLIMKTDSRVKPLITAWVKARLKNESVKIPVKK